MAEAGTSFQAITPIAPRVVSISYGIFELPGQAEEGQVVAVPSQYRLYLSEDSPTSDQGRQGDWYFWFRPTQIKVLRKLSGEWTQITSIAAGTGSGGSGVPPDVQDEIDELNQDLIDGLASANDALLAEVANRTTAILAEHDERVAALLQEASDRDAAILTAKTELQSADNALASQIDVITAAIEDPDTGLPKAHALITAEQTARVDGDTALATSISTLEAETGDLDSRISVVEGALVDGENNEALAFRVSTLESQVQDESTGLLARMDTEEATRASEDEAISTRVDTLEATVTTQGDSITTLSASVSAEATARADQDTALAGSISTVSVTANSALSTANSANGTAGSALSAANAASAAVVNEAAARLAGDNALAAQITTVSADIDDVSAAVTIEASARVSGDNAINSNLATRWGVQLDANGRIVGRIRLDGNATSSTLDFTTDSIRLSHPLAPNVFFSTFSRASRPADTRTFSAASGWAFSHAPAVRLYGPGHASAASNPRGVVNVRGGIITVQIVSIIVGADTPHTVYYRKNGTGSYIALAGLSSRSGENIVTTRGWDSFSGLNATDYFDFYVAPCDASGNVSSTLSGITTSIDLLAFNW